MALPDKRLSSPSRRRQPKLPRRSISGSALNGKRLSVSRTDRPRQRWRFHNLPSESQPVCVQWLLLAQRSRSADDAVNPDQTSMTGRIDCFGRIPLSSYIAPEYITICGKQLVNPKNAIIPHSRKRREFVAYLMKRWGDSERSIMTIEGVSVSWPNRDLHRIPNDFDALRLDNRRGERAASCRRSLLRRSRC
jgi:hypothetical protein